MKNLLAFFMTFALTASLTAALVAAPEYIQQDSFDCHPRAGIGNTVEKLKAGKEVTVAYFGGSITAQNGWRPKTSKFLAEQFPDAKINEIHAAIGGTGSDLGVFRLGHDVLRHNPDLVFIEFATNDGGNSPENIWKQMEGIVRQIWKKDSRTDVVFVYTVTTATVGDYQKGKLARAAGSMEMLADFYGIPTINFGKRVAELVDAEKLVMKADSEPEGKILFAKDGVHPLDAGHELYLADVKAGFAAMKDLPPIDHAPALEKVFIEGNYENAKMLPIAPDMLQGEWSLLKEGEKNFHFTNRTGEMWFSGKPGSKISFKFRGTMAKLYDVLGPDAAQVRVTVDGEKNLKPSPRFDHYCSWYRLATLWCFNNEKDPETVHTITVEIEADQPDRSIVKEFKPGDPKYDGTNWWVGRIMLLGDLVD